MALAVAIFAIVIVGALVAGALFAGTQEQRVGDSSRRLQQSFGVAELGVNSVVRTWAPTTYNLRGVYPTDSVAVPNPVVTGGSPRSTGSFGGYVYKLNTNLFLIDVTGHDTVSGTDPVRRRRRTVTPAPGSPHAHQGAPAWRAGCAHDGEQQPAEGPSDGGWHRPKPARLAVVRGDGARLAGIRTDAGTTVSTQGQADVIGIPESSPIRPCQTRRSPGSATSRTQRSRPGRTSPSPARISRAASRRSWRAGCATRTCLRTGEMG